MELVEHHDADVVEIAVILEPAQQDPLGDEAQPRGPGKMVLETDLVPDFAAELAVPFPRHPRGDGARCDPARLEDDDALVAGQPGVEEHLRHLGRLAGAGGRDEDELVAFGEHADDIGVQLPDRQIARSHVRRNAERERKQGTRSGWPSGGI